MTDLSITTQARLNIAKQALQQYGFTYDDGAEVWMPPLSLVFGERFLSMIEAIKDSGVNGDQTRDEQVDAFIDTWRRQREEINRLQAIVDKLPKTKDGVQWYGQPVYLITNTGKVISNEVFCEFRYTSFFGTLCWCAVFNYGYGLMARVQDCYSTHEAAEKAKITK